MCAFRKPSPNAGFKTLISRRVLAHFAQRIRRDERCSAGDMQVMLSRKVFGVIVQVRSGRGVW
jgi:hypothetical protein